MKLAVVGSINMDMTVTAERIPLKGETLRGDSLHYIPGGKGANQAVAMAKLGAKVEMFIWCYIRHFFDHFQRNV